MAITDINISEQLETGAPSIKYTGNEGPQAPMQTAGADPMLIEEYEKYVYEMQEQGLQPITFEQFVQEIKSGFAFGGRAGSDGRRRYGFGSSLKKRIRKIIPNEAARVAEVAAPFVAPFNPAVAAAMSGIGGFDRHGSISKGLKSGLMNYGMGQAARYMGGAELQGNPFSKTGGYGGGAGAFRGGLEGFKGGFSKPIGTNERFFDDWFKGSETQGVDGAKDIKVFGNEEDEILKLGKINQANKGNALNNFLKGIGMNTAAMAGIVGASALAGLYTKKNPGDDSIEQMRGETLDIDGIRAEVQEAFKDPTGKALEEIRIKYPFLGAKETKNLDLMATGGRAGYYSGGQSIPSEYTVEDARKTAMQDKLGGITDVMKKADLHRQGDIGQMYMAEGGIMDMGGMEKDYRNEGGFVPIGEKEKADDVPARLSVNEFVMTADAVRGMGEGDIDLGAKRMEDLMETLEAKGKRHKGASEMFEVSERLSEVV